MSVLLANYYHTALARLRLLKYFVMRDIQQRFMGGFLGILWAFIQPLCMLMIYAFVFVDILKARLPETVNGDFVTFLALGLWPWTAFSEAIQRATSSIPEHAGLLAKMALPRTILVLAPITASFIVHLSGFVVALSGLVLLGREIHWMGLPIACLYLLLLYGFTIGLGLLLSAISVFLRDLTQALGQIMMLWFFSTPIVYHASLIPASMQNFMRWNPLYGFITGIRDPLLSANALHQPMTCAIVALLMLIVGSLVFQRLSRHFEDFL